MILRRLKLADTQIHVWLTFDREIRDADRRRDFAALLAPDELARARKFLDEQGRQQFVVTRALMRTALSGYAPQVAPADWRFVSGEHGKPALAAPFDSLGIHFNAAHTNGLAALAVARSPILGVDVENLVAGNAPLRVASRFFAADEVRELEALPTGEKRRRFYALWTLKESWLKATGRGLAAGLGNISFTLDRAHRAQAVTLMNDQADAWRFWQSQVSPEHFLALAVRGETPVEWNVMLYRCVPGSPPAPADLPAPRPLGEEQRAEP